MDHSHVLFIVIVGTLLILSIFIKLGSHRFLKIPPIVGYILLGVIFRIADNQFHLLSEGSQWTFDFLAEIGVAALLFLVGLKSDILGLLDQLPRAVVVWFSNVLLSLIAGYFGAWTLGFAPITCLYVAVALSATSIGLSTTAWSEAGRLNTPLGELLVDVAELDDLSAIVLMLGLSALVPLFLAGQNGEVLLAAGTHVIAVLCLKIFLFGLGCWLFARYVEKPFAGLFSKGSTPPDRALSIVGVGMVVAGIAGAIGFSVAIGALFAGLMFSRDPKAIRDKASFNTIHAIFTPFFFAHVGFSLDPNLLAQSASLGGALMVPAVVGKVVGGALPLWRSEGARGALALGVSMVPRAEIALLIAAAGRDMGDNIMPHDVYGALVFVCAASAIVAPLTLPTLLKVR